MSLSPEMVLSPESFATDVARIGSLIGVGSLVYEEVVTLGEVSVAILADELLLGPRRPARPAPSPRQPLGNVVYWPGHWPLAPTHSAVLNWA